mgnify:CR=1 FL=1
MDVRTLMEKINVPDVFSKKVLDFLDTVSVSDYEAELAMINDAEKRNDGFKALTEKLGEDTDGSKIFALEMIGALKTYDMYKELGISDEIYFATMRAFRRQLDESYTEEAGWVFDRGYWDVNHTSLTLFRIGELEYAFANKYGEDLLAVHIPSDAVLTDENLDESFASARAFFRKYYPEAGERRFTCGTWLLSPKLKDMLNENSKILKFQNRFHIERSLGGDGCLSWLFGIRGKTLSDIDLTTLPEKTSLQRSVKAAFLRGENVGQYYGIYKEDDSTWNIRKGKYRHYKGSSYEVLAIAKNSETLEDTVVYRALYGNGEIWVRPAYMWCQRVRKDGVAVPRFEYVGE